MASIVARTFLSTRIETENVPRPLAGTDDLPRVERRVRPNHDLTGRPGELGGQDRLPLHSARGLSGRPGEVFFADPHSPWQRGVRRP